MSSVLLGMTLIAVGWLAIWSVKDHSRPSKNWWPFAMRDEAEAPGEGGTPAGRGGRRRPIVPAKQAPRPWRRSGF